MLGVSGLLGNSSGDGAAAGGAPDGAGGSGGSAAEVGAVIGSNSGGFSEEDKGRGEEGDRNSAGNRWPRQETLALLKIRSDMDVAFRDSSLKGPLWEEVSRKLAELGYHRSAKKCKEKFENVYKYHKRTKEGRASKPDGKTYRFFDQLEALDTHPPPSLLPSLPPPKAQPAAPAPPAPSSAAALLVVPPNPLPLSQITVPSATNPTNISHQSTVTLTINPAHPSPQPPANPTNPSPPPTALTLPPAIPVIPVQVHHPSIPSSIPHASTANLVSNSTSSSSSTSSDETIQGRRKRKRKWKDFFERLMKEVIEKQEELQKKFLEAIEKREHDRMVREEAWKVQEMARLNREHEILVQERSITAAKDAALIAFLQKMSDQQNPVQVQVPVPPPPATDNSAIQVPPMPQPPPQLQQPPTPAPQSAQPPPPQPVLQPSPASAPPLETARVNNGENVIPPSSSRWPKAEVQALINLRTGLDVKYQESGPKGPLWEEISAGMRRLGYNRSAKRCKEKWENINKYFKKVKESNKKRPEDSKTCPYFHQLDALYKEKSKMESGATASSLNPSYGLKVESVINPMVPLMVRPEQQWPMQQESATEEMGSDNMEQNQDEGDDDDGGDDDDDDGDDDEEEDEGGGYEIVTNKAAAAAAASASASATRVDQ
ncbi:trihelix transcription factor DF1-like [Malania oleifera]|uniref:trihelix transcription factor DF1-like n=1 Tax=Malania oleifera TaxID=397392 RepID=UPI0025AECB10|nr:trihelix transcription factor DF1-like [Malania oleifera]